MTEKEAEDAVKLYSKTVYGIAYARALCRTDAEDIYQEVFLRYVSKAPAFKSEEHRKAWFIRVTLNCAAKFLKNRGKTVPLEDIELTGTDDPDADSRAELLRALAALPPKYREVIHLFYYCGLPTEKIAGILRCPRSTVTVRLSRARKMLRSFMEEQI